MFILKILFLSDHTDKNHFDMQTDDYVLHSTFH